MSVKRGDYSQESTLQQQERAVELELRLLACGGVQVHPVCKSAAARVMHSARVALNFTILAINAYGITLPNLACRLSVR